MKQALMAGLAWVLLLFGGAWLATPKPETAQPEKPDTPGREEEKAVLQDSRSVLQVFDGERLWR